MRNNIIIATVLALIGIIMVAKSMAKKVKLNFLGVTIKHDSGDYTLMVNVAATNPLPMKVKIRDVFVQLLDDSGQFVASTKMNALSVDKGESELHIPLTSINVNEALELAMGGSLKNYNVDFSGSISGKKIKFNYIVK